MKEIKAFIHAHRAADLLQALKEAEANGTRICNLAVFTVKALLRETDAGEARYSIELAETVINEIKVELLCPDEAVAFLVEIIRRVAHTGDHEEGWVVVTDTLLAAQIGIGGGDKP